MKNIKLSEPLIDNFEIDAITKVMKSGWLTSGKITQIFEKKVSKYLKVKRVLAVNSCTNGIFATIKAMNLKKGDEVITSPFTFISTINSLYQCGLKIKFADINLTDFNIDTQDLKKKISKKTKCVLITHYGGIPCNLDQIYKLCGKKINIIEDAATALGAEYRKKKVGSFKRSVSVFSLYANKIITTGEGGLIATNNENLARKIKILISIGIDKSPWKRTNEKLSYRYDLRRPGYKFNFTDIQASIGISQMKKLDKIIKRRIEIRGRYNKYLKNLVHKNHISLYSGSNDKKSAEYIYTILIKNNKFKRDNLIKFLKKHKIDSTVHYIPAQYLNFYKRIFSKKNLKNTNQVFRNVISIPFHNKLTNGQIKYVSKKIISFFNNENK
tara:strand:- start:9912 stop:11063 length:1152 start_codon:yes stop_codon:yes gene_type:complete